jgi:hypothetical protein
MLISRSPPICLRLHIARAGDVDLGRAGAAGLGVARAGLVQLELALDVGHGPIAAAGVGQLQVVGAADIAEHRAGGADLGVHRHADHDLRDVLPLHVADAAHVDHALAHHGVAAVDAVHLQAAVDRDVIPVLADLQRQALVGGEEFDLHVGPRLGDHLDHGPRRP